MISLNCGWLRHILDRDRNGLPLQLRQATTDPLHHQRRSGAVTATVCQLLVPNLSRLHIASCKTLVRSTWQLTRTSSQSQPDMYLSSRRLHARVGVAKPGGSVLYRVYKRAKILQLRDLAPIPRFSWRRSHWYDLR